MVKWGYRRYPTGFTQKKKLFHTRKNSLQNRALSPEPCFKTSTIELDGLWAFEMQEIGNQSTNCWKLLSRRETKPGNKGYITSFTSNSIRLLRYKGRSRNDPPSLPDIRQILMKVLFIVYRDEICTSYTSPCGPWQIVLKE